MGCFALAVVFITLPLPNNKGLQKYRISLRYLAGAFLTLALLKVVAIAFNLEMVNLISIETLSIATLQAPLFTFTLITLIHPAFIRKNYMIRQFLPVPIFDALYIFAALNWGNPKILTYSELWFHVFHPAMIVREIFMLYYLFQLLYLRKIFLIQARKYEEEIDNYFSEKLPMHLSWVKYCFNAAFIVGICALLSSFLFSSWMILIFTVAYTLFYLVFGIYYIQYPHIFIFIESALNFSDSTSKKPDKYKRRYEWINIKNQILLEKYYLEVGVTIEVMAQNLQIGRTTLSTFINHEEGMNFNTWINTLRVEESKRLMLENPNLNLIQITEMLGYSECSNFCRHFKIVTNETPSVWRQTQKKQNPDSNHSC
jgi:AraC-like DNA-binding protein